MDRFKDEIRNRIANETEVLLFSDGDLNGCFGDINLIVQEMAIMIDKVSQRSGIRRKEIIQVIRQILKEIK